MRGRKYGLLGSLYVAQGIPDGFFALALVYDLYEKGMTRSQGGILLAAMSIPLALKPFLAPLVDRYGKRATWFLICSILMAGTLSLLSFTGVYYSAVLAIGLLHSIFRAFQDISTDAYALEILKKEEEGPGQGIMKAGSTIGVLVGSSGVLLLAGFSEWETIYLEVAALMVITGAIIPLILARKIRTTIQAPGRKFPWRKVAGMFRGKDRVATLVFGLMAASGYTFFEPSFKPWFKALGHTREEYSVYLIVIMCAIIVGALIGGYLNKKIEVRRMMPIAILATVATYTLGGVLHPFWNTTWVFGGIIVSTAFALGMHGASTFRFFMRKTKLLDSIGAQATVFAIFMATVNVSEVWAKVLGGIAADAFGTTWVFILCGAIQALSLIPLWFATRKDE